MREEEMNCKEICELLTAYLDGEVTPEEKANIEAHLPGCPQCRAELEELSATQVSLRGVLKSIAEEVSLSPEVWEKVRARLDTKGSWLDRLHRLLTSRTWQVATVTAAVVVIAVVAAIWQFGGVGQAPPIPATAPTIPAPPTETPGPAPIVPRPAPPSPLFEVRAVPEEAHYLPGELVEVKLSLTNASSAPIRLDPYPPEIRVTPRLNHDQVLFSVAAGTQPLEIKPNDFATLEFSWDQKDKSGNQVQPGWYDVIFRDISVRQGDTRYGFSPGAHVLIQYLQGVMEKSLDLNQSQAMNGITMTLQRIELTSAGMTVYAFNTPPGYNFPSGQPLPAPSMMFDARAEYSVDGEVFKLAGSSGIRPLENGMLNIWDNLDPVPKNAKELIFRITKLGDWTGPWEFRIPLE